jgi:8-oxo-dGTP diphosphatase
MSKKETTVPSKHALHVVAAIFIQDNRILACRRAPHKSSPGLWEFPGGKVDPGEDSFTALEREIREELSLKCQPLRMFDVSETELGEQVIRLETIYCALDKVPELVSTDHDQFLWVKQGQIKDLDWAGPDLPAVRKLLGLPSLDGLAEGYF